MRGLVIGGLDPGPIPAIEFIDGVDGLEKERWQELGLGAEEIPLDLSLGPGVVGLGVEEADAEVGADNAKVLAAKGGTIVGVQFFRQPAGEHGLAEAIQQVFESFAWIELGVDAEAGAIVQEGEEEGALGFAVRELDDRAVHAIAHPQQVGQGHGEGLGGAVGQAGAGLETAPIQASLAETAMEGAKAEGARVEKSLAYQLLDEGPEGEGGMLTTDPKQSLEGLGVDGAMGAAIAAGLVVQGGKLAVAVAVEPGLDGGGRIEPSIPRVLGGQLKGLRKRQSVLARLLDRLNGREAGEGLLLTWILVRGSG